MNNFLQSILDINDKCFGTLDNIPSNLFKFRQCNERNFETFYNDQIWISNAENMNDAYECRIFFEKKKVEKWIDSVTSINEEDFNKKYIEYKKKIKELKKFLHNINLNTNYQIIKNILQSDIYGNSINTSNEIKFNYENPYNDFKDKIKKIKLGLNDKLLEIICTSINTVLFTSLSSDISSPCLWGHYGDSEKGFALSYNFQNDLFDETICEIDDDELDEGKISINDKVRVHPIKYKNKRYSIPSKNIILFLKQYLKICDIPTSHIVDELDLIKDDFEIDKTLYELKNIILNKSVNWSYEKEWRLFKPLILDSNNVNPNIINKKANAIYLGRRISKKNQQILVDLARKKQIPVYKMALDINTPNYELIYHKL